MAKESKKEKDNATTQSAPADKIFAGDWRSSQKLVRKKFPGPADAKALLRVAMERAAYAELIAHAKESLDKEICGVLAGTVCEDDDGPFVHVAAVIRGRAASHGSTHVTFTQQTWNEIHKTLEHDYPNLQIVGWYHSHPGFGVEFSDMDLFIQRNFFSGPTQIALVTDPLSGAVAICPAAQATGGESPESFRALEARMSQLLQAVDEQRAFTYRFMMTVGMAIGVTLIACFGYTYYSNYRYRNEPPKTMQIVPVPIAVGDKTVMLGVGIEAWQVPEELNAAIVQLEKDKRAAAEKAAQAAAKADAPNPATTSTNTAAKQ